MRFRWLVASVFFISVNANSEQLMAKNFILPSLDNSQNIELNTFLGKVVYLDFWASWCSSCAQALPLFKIWQKEFGRDFVVVSVNVDEDKADGLAMTKKLQLDYLVAYDSQLEVAKSYGVTALPLSFIINKQGNIYYRHFGFKDGDGDKLKALITELLTH